MKNQKAITLVALIITIIILLILATVSISLMINNGIIDKAKYGVDKYSEEQELEQIKLAVASARLKGNGFLTTTNLNSELQVIFNNEETVKANDNSDYYTYKASKNYIIYKDGKVEEGFLPKEYQQVEYIESTGSQYIDTQFIPNQDTRVVIDFQLTTSSSNGYAIFGSRVSASSRGYTFQKVSTGYWGGMYGSTLIQGGTKNYDINRHIVDKNKNIVYLDGSSLMSFSSSTYTCPESLYIFAAYSNGGTSYATEPIVLYSCQIYDNGNIIRNFIPCYRISDEVIGLYDTVEGKFYTNQGEGTFEKGNNV